MKKLSKKCSVQLFVKNTSVVMDPDLHDKEVTEENIKEALAVADQFDEICKIVKDAYSL